VQRRVDRGESRDDARRAVAVEMGGLDQVKEQVREVRAGRLFDETWRDVVYACRGLRRAPGFTAAALSTLALGVAANTAIFSVAQALLIDPLPFRTPDRLVVVWADQRDEGYPRAPLSGPEVLDLDQRASQFVNFGAIWSTTAALTGESAPEQLRVGLVTTDFFSVLGASAALGRTFGPGDDSTGPPASILLSGAVWRRRYGGDPDIVGKRVDVNGQPAIVVGVMPVGFRLMMPPDSAIPDDLEAWLPLNRGFVEGPRGQRYLRVVGRMKDGVSLEAARTDVDRIGREISAANAFYGAAGRQFETRAFHDDSTREVRSPLLVLSAGVAILLLIACVNVGSLQVARTAARAREFAVKAALGAGTWRLVRQHLTEALVLGGLGAVLGVAFGYAGLRVLLTLTPASLGRLHLATVSIPVVLISTLTVLAWMTFLAFAPVREALRASASSTLDGGRRHTAGRGRRTLRHVLTVLQLALSVVLVVIALLLARTVQRTQQMDAGFSADGVLSFRLALRGSSYPDQEAFNAFARRLQESLGSLPGVSSAAAVSHAPYDHVPNWGGPYLAVEGGEASTAPQADYRAVTPGAMELLGVRLLDGRLFTEADGPSSALAVIVDERLARRAWPDGSGVGRRLGVDPSVTGIPSDWATVVGVVRHVRHRSPVEEVRDQVYFSSRQVIRNPSVYLVRTTANPTVLAPSARQAVRALDPSLPIYDLRPLNDYVVDALALRQFTTVLAALFAVCALLLAAVGVYGLLSYAVTERRREFGVRRSLGARTTDVVGLVLGEAAAVTVTGAMIGLLVGTGGAMWLRREPYGVAPWDPVAIGASVGILAVVAFAACAWPTYQAVRTEPASALRD
jgi:predicted permease